MLSLPLSDRPRQCGVSSVPFWIDFQWERLFPVRFFHRSSRAGRRGWWAAMEDEITSWYPCNTKSSTAFGHGIECVAETRKRRTKPE